MSKNEKEPPEKIVDKKTVIKKTAGLKKPTAENDTKKANWPVKILSMLVLFIGGALSSLYFLPDLKERLPIIAEWVGENSTVDIAAINQRITNQQAEIEALKQKSLVQDNLLSQLSGQTEDKIPAELITRIETLEQSLGTVPEVVSGQQDNSQSTRIDLLLSRMSQLEASFIPLSKNMIDAASAEKERQTLSDTNAALFLQIDDLGSRLLNVETIVAKDNSGLLINIKVAELKRKVIAGTLYDGELITLTSLLDDSGVAINPRFKTSLDYLGEKATTGIVTPDQLRNDFNDLIPQLLSVSDITPSGPWWQNMLNSVGNLISIRKTDGTSYNEAGLDGSISNIESWLGRGDIKAALNSVLNLPGGTQTALENWISDAKRWTQSEDAISDLEIIAAQSYLRTDAQ